VKFYILSKVILPSIEEVARCKARAFGRKIYTHGAYAAYIYGFINPDDTENAARCYADAAGYTHPSAQSKKVKPKMIFAVAGHTTSFQYGKTRIVLKGTSAKRLKAGDSIPGLLIRGLKHAGIREGSKQLINSNSIFVRREHKQQLQTLTWQMPWWLSNQFHTADVDTAIANNSYCM